MKVIKRDGTLVPFDKNKIINAINKAFLEVDGVLYEIDTANDIANDIENLPKEKISVEEINFLEENAKALFPNSFSIIAIFFAISFLET